MLEGITEERRTKRWRKTEKRWRGIICLFFLTLLVPLTLLILLILLILLNLLILLTLLQTHGGEHAKEG